MKSLILFMWIECILTKLACAEVRLDPLVQINQGLVRGQLASDGNYASFLGIPYAKVNIDDPFGPALPAEKFEDTFNAFSALSCPSTNMNIPGLNTIEQSLDCLRLNVFVPDDANSQHLLPVLVWIHGGFFDVGSGTTKNVNNIIKNDIILVTINYRLGVYGFMCLDIPEVPGNRGLKDQQQALHWIKYNIKALGGNPDDITIAGDSAGSCSVLLHLFSPQEKLFNKVIAESGTPQTAGMFVNADVDAAIKLANYFEYNTTNTHEALEFLGKLSPDEVVSAHTELKFSLRPCEERVFEGIERFIDSNPFSLTNINNIKSTPIIIGHTSKEETNSAYAFSELNYNHSADVFYEKLRDNFILSEEELVKLSKIVKHFYIGDEIVLENIRFELADFNSDFHFNYPVQRMINLLLEENANPVFEYVFSYTGGTGASGAAHSEELKYLFGAFTNENDILLQERISTLWANFVKYGNPTPEATELLPMIWEPVTVEKRPYLEIDANLDVKHSIFKDRMAFWDLFYSVYIDSHHLIHK